MVAVSKKTASNKAKVVAKHPFFAKTPKNFNIGGAIQPKRDLTRFVRWPTCVQLQRKRAVLLGRLKVPPALNQFRHCLNKNEATQLFRLLAKYRPETTEGKKARLVAEAEARSKGEETKSKKPVMLKHGLNHVVDLIEQKKAKLVVIAHDVDPIELIVFLPALCRKMEVPYCIVKGKSRLGTLIHQKKATAIVVDNVRKEDQPGLDQLIKNFAPEFIDNVEVRRRWGN